MLKQSGKDTSARTSPVNGIKKLKCSMLTLVVGLKTVILRGRQCFAQHNSSSKVHLSTPFLPAAGFPGRRSLRPLLPICKPVDSCRRHWVIKQLDHSIQKGNELYLFV